jgi:hypothetical protein
MSISIRSTRDFIAQKSIQRLIKFNAKHITLKIGRRVVPEFIEGPLAIAVFRATSGSLLALRAQRNLSCYRAFFFPLSINLDAIF